MATRAGSHAGRGFRYGALYRAGQIIEAGCWAHARRKLYDLFKLDQSPIAQKAIARIGSLYAVEREIRGGAVSLRQSVRQRRAAPLLANLKAWLESVLMTISIKSELAKAIKYTLGHWTALTRYCDDGRIEIDNNNTAERSIRPLVIGRRNYLFAGSDGGGDSAAIIYSLIGTARLNEVEPYANLRAVLELIADHPINQIDELLPWHLDLQNDALPKAA